MCAFIFSSSATIVTSPKSKLWLWINQQLSLFFMLYWGLVLTVTKYLLERSSSRLFWYQRLRQDSTLPIFYSIIVWYFVIFKSDKTVFFCFDYVIKNFIRLTIFWYSIPIFDCNQQLKELPCHSVRSSVSLFVRLCPFFYL